MTHRHDTDPADNQWNAIAGYFPDPEKMGRPKNYSPIFATPT